MREVIRSPLRISWASQVALVVKDPPANAGDIRDLGPIPGLGRSSGGGHGNSLQYSCLENPMDRGTWWATVPWGAESRTWLKWFSTQEDFRSGRKWGLEVVSLTDILTSIYYTWINTLVSWTLISSFNKWEKARFSKSSSYVYTTRDYQHLDSNTCILLITL